MRRILFTCFMLSALLWSLPLWAAETVQGKVVSVADGDTITVLQDETQVKVRLNGVDAPEKAQDFGTASRKFTADLCFGKEVTVNVTDTDRYGRKVGIVNLPDGRVLNHALVEAGLAHWYEAYAPNDGALKRLQEEAKSAQRGLWSRSDVVAPWDFRKSKRNGDSKDEGSVVKPATEAKPASRTSPSGEVYITETGKKYHTTSCRTLKESKIAITKTDAVNRGYGPCGICKP